MKKGAGKFETVIFTLGEPVPLPRSLGSRGNADVELFGWVVLPQSGHVVVVKHDVDTYEREVFRQALNGKAPVKRVAMVEGQCCELGHVAEAEREQREPVFLHLFWNQQLEGLFEVEPSEADLDGDFPEACGADPFGVSLVLDKGSRVRTELRASFYEPQKGVRVQEQVHSI